MAKPLVKRELTMMHLKITSEKKIVLLPILTNLVCSATFFYLISENKQT